MQTRTMVAGVVVAAAATVLSRVVAQRNTPPRPTAEQVAQRLRVQIANGDLGRLSDVDLAATHLAL